MRRVMGTVDITGVQPTHGWRHTAATLLLDSGQNIKTIATRLGHSTPAITQALYVHQWPSAMSNRRGISAAS
jgi:integrase